MLVGTSLVATKKAYKAIRQCFSLLPELEMPKNSPSHLLPPPQSCFLRLPTTARQHRSAV